VALEAAQLRATGIEIASLVYQCVGRTAQDMIVMMGLPPTGPASRPCREFEEWVEGLSGLYRAVVTPGVEFAAFDQMKQKTDEPIVNFMTNLANCAVAVGIETNSDFFRHVPLKGMRNRTLADTAVKQNLSLGDIIARGSTREQ
jgi:hypothetical protein